MVELLAVIVILAVLILIAVTAVLPQMKKSRENAFVDVVYQYLRAVETNTVADGISGEYELYSFPGYVIDGITKQPKSGYIIRNEQNKYKASFWDSNSDVCVTKDFNESEATINKDITESECVSVVGKITTGATIESITGIPSKVTINGVEQDAVLKPECFTFDSNNNVTNFNTDLCGKVVVVPNKIGDTTINGIATIFESDTITAVYIEGVENLTTLPEEFLSKTNNIKTAYIANLPKYEVVNKLNYYKASSFDLGKLQSVNKVNDSFNESNIENVTIQNHKSLKEVINSYNTNNKLKTINISNNNSLEKINQLSNTSTISGDLIIMNNKSLTEASVMLNSTKVNNVSIKNNPLLNSVKSSFHALNANKLLISNNDGLTVIDDIANGTRDVKEIEISANKNLQTITGIINGGKVNKVVVNNNPKLATIQNAFIASNTNSIIISNNDNLTAISGFMGSSKDLNIVFDNNDKLAVTAPLILQPGAINSLIFKNSKNITNMSNIKVTGNINVVDLSGTEITSLPELSFSTAANTNYKIGELILPTTVKSIDASAFSGVTVDKVYAAGSNKCALNSLLEGKVASSALETCN